MTKLHISYRNARGQMKSADPFNCPADAPAEVQAAAAAIVAAMGAATVAQAPAAPVKGKRGRPVGYKCSPETRQAMREAKIAMWQQIKAHLSDVEPEKWAE